MLPEALKFDWSSLGIQADKCAVVAKTFQMKDLDYKAVESNVIKRFFNFEKMMTPNYTMNKGTTLALTTVVSGARVGGWVFDAYTLGVENKSIGSDFKFYYGVYYDDFQKEDPAWLLFKTLYLAIKQGFVVMEPKNKFAEYTIAYRHFVADRGKKLGIRQLSLDRPNYEDGNVEIKGFNNGGDPIHKLFSIETIAKAYSTT